MREPGAQAVITEETDGSLGIDNFHEGFTITPCARIRYSQGFAVGRIERYRSKQILITTSGE